MTTMIKVFKHQKFKAVKIEEGILDVLKFLDTYKPLIDRRQVGKFINMSLENTGYKDRLKTDSEIRRARYQYVMGMTQALKEGSSGILINFLRGIDKGDYKCILRSLPEKYLQYWKNLSSDLDSKRFFENIMKGKKF